MEYRLISPKKLTFIYSFLKFEDQNISKFEISMNSNFVFKFKN